MIAYQSSPSMKKIVIFTVKRHDSRDKACLVSTATPDYEKDEGGFSR
ncbi:hypothetical protein MTBBW1_980015 [Desulfamplus magnetovallimortis]|uniref:Uncharacterized protein n=1 Tax=Desulfamplus magnetovallimortis TaxID=1246637 RepID=A0A1W1HLF5_9BACT|nr:hypothetical protein MTBBW1_980015 [Desulfamplus magnetovallimortis]